VISPGYTDDPSGTLSQREDQPSAYVIGDNVQVCFCCSLDTCSIDAFLDIASDVV